MRQPTRAQVMRLATTAAKNMPPEARERLINAVSGQEMVVWGSDSYASCSCPLRAAGFERDYDKFFCPWKVSGGEVFQHYWDAGMTNIVGLDKGAVGVLP